MRGRMILSRDFGIDVLLITCSLKGIRWVIALYWSVLSFAEIKWD